MNSGLNKPLSADRDGTMDIVFPTCETHSSSSGVGKTCSINIAYNKQKPLCSSTTSSSWMSVGQKPMGNSECRSLDQLCQADEGFGFDLNPKGDVSVRYRYRSLAHVHIAFPVFYLITPFNDYTRCIVNPVLSTISIIKVDALDSAAYRRLQQ
jgi:hypothetical protein